MDLEYFASRYQKNEDCYYIKIKVPYIGEIRLLRPLIAPWPPWGVEFLSENGRFYEARFWTKKQALAWYVRNRIQGLKPQIRFELHWFLISAMLCFVHYVLVTVVLVLVCLAF